MITRQKTITLSPYQELYDLLVKKDSFLRRFHDEIDLGFIYGELLDKYSPDMGRSAIDPVLMFKCLILKTVSGLSDEDLMEEITVNLEYKYFLDMAPEDMPPSPSSLCRFRRQRLADAGMMGTLLGKSLQMAMERGIVAPRGREGKTRVSVIIDGTHTESFCSVCRPVPALKERTKRLRAALYSCDESLSGRIKKDHGVSSTDLLGEMGYCRQLLDAVETRLPALLELRKVKLANNNLKELLDDISAYYSVNPADPDARVGHKSGDTEFFGYKSQIAIDEESGLILDAEVTSGEVGDAIPGLDVMERLTDNPLLEVDEMLGDTAYSGQPFLALGRDRGFAVIAPPHPILGSGIDGRGGFTFNKDADRFCCPMGHLATSQRTVTHKKDNCRRSIIYSFDPRKCSVCPIKRICVKGKRQNYRTFSVAMLTPEQKALLEAQKTDRFKERRRMRYKIEAKNAHLKQSFGMAKAKGKGIKMMTLQAAVAFFTSNVKTILSKSDRPAE